MIYVYLITAAVMLALVLFLVLPWEKLGKKSVVIELKPNPPRPKPTCRDFVIRIIESFKTMDGWGECSGLTKHLVTNWPSQERFQFEHKLCSIVIDYVASTRRPNGNMITYFAGHFCLLIDEKSISLELHEIKALKVVIKEHLYKNEELVQEKVKAEDIIRGQQEEETIKKFMNCNKI